MILFGATGMIGGGALLECLADNRVDAVLAIGRSSSGVSHPKLSELHHENFLDFEPVRARLSGYDACFYCLGVTSVGMDEAGYSRITYDVTLAAARAFLAANREGTFCYISGAGADSSERGPVMWGRVKGRTENALLALRFRQAYMLRPGLIQPVKGVRSKTVWYQAFYTVMAPIAPLVTRLAPGVATTTAVLGRAMIQLAAAGAPHPIITSQDINRLGALPG